MEAFASGHTHVLDWLVASYPAHSVFRQEHHAARAPTPASLQRRLDHGRALNQDDVIYAVRACRRENLQWLRARGLAWDGAAEEAAAVGHLHMLLSLLNEGCPADLQACVNAAAQPGYTHVVAWLNNSHGVAPTPAVNDEDDEEDQ